MKIKFLSLIGMLGFVVNVTASTFEVNPAQSKIQVNAQATGHSFNGLLQKYTLSAEGDTTSLQPSALNFSWSFKDLDTDDDKRDAEMIKWLGGGNPTGSFKLSKTYQKNGKNYAMGSLTIKGVSKEIAFPYTSKLENGVMTIDGTAEMNYQTFGLPIIRAMAVMTVDPKLSIQLHLVGKVK